MTSLFRSLCFAFVATAACIAARPAAAQDTIKIGYVDPFSGPFASGGDEFLKVFAYILAKVNADGGALGKKFEIVPFDDKLQPAEALIALKNITDQNMPFVMQCTGSNVGAALVDGVSKHNARNPDNRILYLNCGALATELTNEHCDFWQFRFSGNVEMRAAARVKALPKDVTKVYLLNQDYLFGQSVQRDTRKWLAKLRPDVQVVGDELMPFGKVQDFSPYVEKIKSSGAQSVITGNYNRDLNLLIKAAVDEVPFLTMFQMLAKAIDQAGSTDPLKVALALEGMKATDLVGSPVEMRKEDHQLLMPYYAATFSRDVKYDAEKTGFGWKTDFIATAEDLTLPTTCKMKRPAS